jgi:hypothetical protein
MKSVTFIRCAMLSVLVCTSAAACTSSSVNSVSLPGPTGPSSPAPAWLAAKQLPDTPKGSWIERQIPVTVTQSAILKAISATNFPTAPAACRLPATAFQTSMKDWSDLFEQGQPNNDMIGSTSDYEGATQFLLDYGTSGAAEQAATQITTSIEACHTSLNQSMGINGGAHGKLSDPSSLNLALAAQLAQAEPQCIDVYVLARCTEKLTRPLTDSIALQSHAVDTTTLPGAGVMAPNGYSQNDSVYLVQRGTYVSMLFVDVSLGFGASLAGPTPVLQAMVDDFTGAGGQ